MILVRKSIAVIAVLLLVAVPIGSIFVERRLFGGSCTVLAYSVFCLGAWICVLNFYLSFLRPLVHPLLRRQGKLRNVSGIPLVGMAVVAGLLLAPASVGLSVACLVLMLLDTGNLIWFVACVWRDDSFWRLAT
jgi:hypothetical protein